MFTPGDVSSIGQNQFQNLIFSLSHNGGSCHDLPDMPSRVFGDVKQQTENICRQPAPTDEAFFK